MKKIKILFTTSLLTGGGAERVMALWASKLANKGFGVSILVSSNSNNEYYISNNVTKYSITNNYEDYKKISSIKKIILKRKIIKKISPDYIVCFLTNTLLTTYFATLFMKKKLIGTIRVSPWHSFINKNFFYKKLCNFIFSRCHKVIVQTDEQKNYFKKNMQSKLITIHNTLSSDFMRYDEYKNYSTEIAQLIAVGRISIQKNYRLMIDAIEEVVYKYNLSRINLSIYGVEEDDSIISLKNYIKEKKLEGIISFKGRNNNMLEVYKKSDIFLMTSNFEGLPNALMEAMACKLVCVSTNCKTGPKDLIENNLNGYLVPINDAHKFAEAVVKALKLNSEKKIEIGNNARRKVLSFANDDMIINSLIKIFN